MIQLKTLILLTSLITFSHALYFTNFTINFYQLIAKYEQDSNFVISPASLILATGLVLQGATGETRQQIETSLADSNHIESLASKFKADNTLESANKIFVAQKFDLKESYQRSVSKIFDSKAEKVDFSSKDETAEKINNFIKESTKGLIKEMIKPEALDNRIAAMLINAIYYKGAWQFPFMMDKFSVYNFHKKNEQVKLNFMSIDEKFKYAQFDNYGVKLVELPYKYTDISMVVLVPLEVDGLRNVEENLTKEILEEMLSGMTVGERNVMVFMPRFKIEFEKRLDETIKELGIRKIFDMKAELNELVNGPDLVVGEVLQKAVIDVNENGTEAAAATSYKTYPRCGHCGPLIFKVDRPFLFLLKNNDYVFFMGRVTEPEYD